MAKLLSADKFADFCIERAKACDGYIMCAVGQNPRKLSSWYFDQYKDNSKQYAKALYWKQNAARVWDCQGMADGYTTEQLGEKINVRARNNYADWCGVKGTGKIPTKYRVRGAAVFIHNGDYVSHVGFLVDPVDPGNPAGDWYVVEARGVLYGVVTTRLNSRNWNRWGLMTKYFSYDEAKEEPEAVFTLGARTLKRGMKGADVAELQAILVDLGFHIGKYGTNGDGIDGDFGALTEAAIKKIQAVAEIDYDGVYGEETHAALMELVAEAAAPEDDDEAPEIETKIVKITAKGRWNIRTGAGTSYPVVTVVSCGASFTYVSTAQNGWHEIEINGRTGWVSYKCAEVA